MMRRLAASRPLAVAARRMSTALNMETINPAVKEAQYAVRGELVLRAA